MIAGIACSRSASGITTSEFFAPPSACTRLPVAHRAFGDDARRLGAADEGDRVDAGVLEDRGDRVAAAVDEVDDAGRDLLDRVDDLDDQRRRARVLLGGLEQEGVAAGDRVGQEPERDHRREVEGRDRRDDADRLAHQLDVDAGGDALQRLALEQVRDRRRRLDRLDPAADLAVGVGQRLAHVGADQRDQLLAAAQQLLAQRQHRPRPPLRRHLAPAGLRRSRRRDRLAHLAAPESGTSAVVSPLAGSTSSSVATPSAGRHSRRRSWPAAPLPPASTGQTALSSLGRRRRAPGRGTFGLGPHRRHPLGAALLTKTSATAIAVTAKSIVASTLTWTGMPRRLTP